MVRIAALIVVAALAGAPAAAGAASNPLLSQPASQQQQQAPAPAQPQQAPMQTTTVESGSLSGGEVLLIALAVAALIGGIWLVIARDARRMTAGRTRSSDSELAGGRGGSATRAGHRSRKLSSEERKRRKRGRAR